MQSEDRRLVNSAAPQAWILPQFEAGPVGGHGKNRQTYRMYGVDLSLGRGGGFVHGKFAHVELIGLLQVEVVCQVHIPIVQQTLRDA